jgi:hypothetical protein
MRQKFRKKGLRSLIASIADPELFNHIRTLGTYSGPEQKLSRYATLRFTAVNDNEKDNQHTVPNPSLYIQ